MNAGWPDRDVSKDEGRAGDGLASGCGGTARLVWSITHATAYLLYRWEGGPARHHLGWKGSYGNLGFVGEFVAERLLIRELDPFIYGPGTRFHLKE